MRIWKWTLVTTDRQALQMPKGAQILSVQVQGENAQLWALCDENAPRETRQFAIHGTGNPMPDGDPGSYVGTYQLYEGKLVFHVFELPA
jgi:hypothetical protein